MIRTHITHNHWSLTAHHAHQHPHSLDHNRQHNHFALLIPKLLKGGGNTRKTMNVNRALTRGGRRGSSCHANPPYMSQTGCTKGSLECPRARRLPGKPDLLCKLVSRRTSWANHNEQTVWTGNPGSTQTPNTETNLIDNQGKWTRDWRGWAPDQHVGHGGI